MELILWFILVIVIYLSYEIFVIRKDKALENMKHGRELTLLQKKYKLDYDKLDMKKIARMVGLANAFIISTVVSLVCLLQRFIDNIILWSLAVIGVGILLLIPLILVCYSFIGKSLKKKQEGLKHV